MPSQIACVCGRVLLLPAGMEAGQFRCPFCGSILTVQETGVPTPSSAPPTGRDPTSFLRDLETRHSNAVAPATGAALPASHSSTPRRPGYRHARSRQRHASFPYIALATISVLALLALFLGGAYWYFLYSSGPAARLCGKWESVPDYETGVFEFWEVRRDGKFRSMVGIWDGESREYEALNTWTWEVVGVDGNTITLSENIVGDNDEPGIRKVTFIDDDHLEVSYGEEPEREQKTLTFKYTRVDHFSFGADVLSAARFCMGWDE